MHELSLCQNTLEIIEDYAKQHQVSRVTAVWLEIGVLSCVEEKSLRFAFEVVCRGSIAENSQLHIVHCPALAWCWDCSRSVEINQYGAGCPHCLGHNLRQEKNEQLRIKEIEVE